MESRAFYRSVLCVLLALCSTYVAVKDNVAPFLLFLDFLKPYFYCIRLSIEVFFFWRKNVPLSVTEKYFSF